MTDKFDYEELFSCSGTSPIIKFIIRHCKERQEKGEDEFKLLGETIKFLATESNCVNSIRIGHINESIQDMLYELVKYEAWPNLGRIAAHALELQIQAFNKSEFPDSHDIMHLMKIKAKVANMSIPDLEGAFKPEFLQKIKEGGDND